MNDMGHVVGRYNQADGNWAPAGWNGVTGRPRKIAAPPMARFFGGRAMAINNQDMAVGASWTDGRSRPTLWDREGRPTDLGLLLSDPRYTFPASIATDINEANVVTVNAAVLIDGSSVQHAAVWQNGVLTDLDPFGASLIGIYASSANAINNHGTVVGSRGYWAPQGQSRATRWTAGNAEELGTLFPDALRQMDVAVDINDDGVIVGRSSDALAFGTRATRWVGTVATDLGGLSQTDGYTVANSINNHGVVVGTTGSHDFWMLTAAVMWDGGRAIDLNELLDPEDRARWKLDAAFVINDRGQIMGEANKVHGKFRSRQMFVMTPR